MKNNFLFTTITVYQTHIGISYRPVVTANWKVGLSHNNKKQQFCNWIKLQIAQKIQFSATKADLAHILILKWKSSRMSCKR
jgi:hypothetical protein